MKLQALQLTYFKRHVDLAISFSDTLTVIRGPNWAGKSSILHAIFFALFGAAAVPCAKERIPTRGQKNTKVSLWFEWNGVDCVIERTLTTCSLYVGDTLKATSASAVSQFVQEEILGLSLKDALTLAYSPQSQTAALLTLGVPALNRMIESLTQADLIENLITRAAKVVQNTEAQLAVIGSTDVDEPQAQVDTWRLEVAAAQTNFDSCVQAQQGLQDELREVEKRHAEASALYQLMVVGESAQREVERIKTSLYEISRDLNSLGSFDMEDLNAKLARLNEEYVGPYTQKVEIDRQQTELKRLDEWFDSVGKDWQDKEPNIELLAKAKAALDQVTQAHLDASMAYEKTKAEYATKAAELEHGVCPECERPFENFNPEEAQKAFDLANKNAALAKDFLVAARDAVTQAKAEVARLERVQPPLDYEQQHAAKVDQYELLQKSLEAQPHPADLAKSLVEISTAIEGVKVEIAQARTSQSRRVELASRKASLEHDLGKLEKELAAVPAGPRPDMGPLMAEVSALRQKIHDMVPICNERASTLNSAKGDLRAWEQLLSTAQASREKGQVLEARAKRFDALLKWLRQSKSAFLGRIWDQLTLVASEIVTGATSGYASSLHRTDDGEFVVVEDGEEVPMISASGGMASICGVALRMALDHVLSQSVGFVVLDEPSSELNDEHAASLAGALRAQQRQVILVTHREGEEFVSDTVISL